MLELEARKKYDSRVPTKTSEGLSKPNPRIPTKLVDEARALAEADRRSLNDVIVIALEQWVERNRKPAKTKK